MERFKEKEMEKQDMNYGESIIEVRMISAIDGWFFKKMNLRDENLITRLREQKLFEPDEDSCDI